MIADIVAKNLYDLRKQKGLTQGELAGHIHYSDKVISKWERGESTPDIEALVVLTDFYKVSLDTITKDHCLIQHFQNENDNGNKANDDSTEPPPDKAAWDAMQKLKQKKLISRGARIATLVILPMLMNLFYLIQEEIFSAKFFSSEFYFLSVIPAVLLANLIISLIIRRTFDSTEVLFLLFASIWTTGLVVIFMLWHIGIIAPGSQRMRIWYVLLFYNIIVALGVIITGMGIKKFTKMKKRG